MLERLTDPVRRCEYAGLLADLAGVSETSVLESLRRRLGGRPEEVQKAMRTGTAAERVEREMLRLLARGGPADRGPRRDVDEDLFRTATNRALFVALRDADCDVRRRSPAATIAQLAGQASPRSPSSRWRAIRPRVRAGRVGAAPRVPC